LEDQLYRSLLTSLSLTAASEKPPISMRPTIDISTTKKKMEEGQSFFDKVCIIMTHYPAIFLNLDYVVSPLVSF
jgi:hypothetical protein